MDDDPVDHFGDTIAGLLEDIAALDETEALHVADAVDWARSGTQLCRLVKPATPPKHLVSYCVLVDPREDAVLLVDHRDAQRWLPTGGHVDPGEHPAQTARREIHEELGIQPDFLQSVGPRPLMATVTETAGLSVGHVDVSLWFVFEGSTSDALTVDPGEFVDSRWWTFDAVVEGPGTRFDPHLPRFIQKLRRATQHAPS